MLPFNIIIIIIILLEVLINIVIKFYLCYLLILLLLLYYCADWYLDFMDEWLFSAYKGWFSFVEFCLDS